MKNKKIILGGICLGMCLLTACGDESANVQETESVVVEKVDTSVVLDGTVAAREEQTVFAKEAGEIKAIEVEEGDEVSKDDIMIEYTLPGEDEETEESKEKNVKTKKVKCKLESALVTSLEVVEGQHVMEGTPLFTLTNNDAYYISAEVLENFIADIAVDREVTIIPNSDRTKTYTGKITRIYPMAYENKNGDTVVKVDVEMDEQDEMLPLGYTVKIKVE